MSEILEDSLNALTGTTDVANAYRDEHGHDAAEVVQKRIHTIEVLLLALENSTVKAALEAEGLFLRDVLDVLMATTH